MALDALAVWNPRRLLDAGCGVSVWPHLFARLGYDVVALDASRTAIHHRHPSPADKFLASCLQIVGARERFLARQFPPRGALRYRIGRWEDVRPLDPVAPFDVIVCHNGLRRSPKREWRRAARAFVQRLAPGGVLVLENLNAIGVRNEARSLLEREGFTLMTAAEFQGTMHILETALDRDLTKRYVLDFWPTG